MVVTGATIHRMQKLLGVLQYVLITGALCIIVDAVIFAEPVVMPREVSVLQESMAEARTDGPARLEDYSSLWRRSLRQTLIEPEPVEKPKVKPPEPKLSKPIRLPRLLATFVEQERSWGLFQSQKGNRCVRGEAARIDGFDIVKISPGTAALKKDGKIHEVKVPRRAVHQSRPVRRRG
jgi:hypothetical protein